MLFVKYLTIIFYSAKLKKFKFSNFKLLYLKDNAGESS